MFAFGLSTLALQNVLPPNMASSASISATKRNRLSIYLLTMTGVVFRSEIAILLAAQTLYLLLNRRVTLQNEIIPAGIGGALVGLLLTVSVDSFFWERFPLWPEFVGFYYNAIEGKSSEWGTSAWSFYFTNAIPRLLMNPMTWEVCIPMAIAMKATRRASIDILLPLLLFIGVYSLQPHKEWRFIVYAVPGFTAVASLGASWIWSRRSKSMVYRLLGLALLASTVGSFTVSFGMLAISQLNYPGAEALSRLHNLAHGSQVIINVHLDTLSCMSGITRFQEIPPPHAHSPRNHTLWKYDKTEDPQDLLHPAFWERFDYVLAERPETVIGRWEIIDTVDGFAGVSLRSPEDRDIGRFETVSAERGLRSALYDYTVGWLWKDAENLIRDHVTRGWWIGIRMEPKIRILKKQRAPQRIAPG
ncbi:MAG: dolichyl-P-Man:Man(7)GlcNAc(2)-PP-dolichol alpha-1,6-mannosyltransferase [Pycnora praestabilis]|nr:MAG: dolichyl-P-Man:Man(7)GlcNAc(2)-PP-dolichol alpha-1,6-mannosyltransferase [Pycnora praestabilis]